MNKPADSAPNVKTEDLVETKVVATEAVQAIYEQEKLLIVLNKKPSVFSGRIKSSIWKNVYHIDWAEMHCLIKLCHFDLSKYKGIVAIADVLKNPKYKKDIASKNFEPFYRRAVICPYRWVNKNTPLATTFIVLSNKSISNYHVHMKRLHPDIPLEDEGTVSSKHSMTGEVSTSSKATLGVKPEPIDLVEDGPLDRFANKDPTTKAGARKALQRAIYECINDLGFPSSTVEKPVFRALLETVHRNAKLISDKDFEISNKLLSSICLQSYNGFVQLISMLISNVHTRYEELCGKTTPFATLCHDVGNGVNKDVLGSSLMFADLRNGNVYRIPLGLITSQGHTACQVCDLSVALLSFFGVQADTDLFRTVNDNTNSTVLAGKYILNHQGEGKCDMHITDLILKHATGLVIRMKKITVDSNPSFIASYNKFREFSNWLMKSCQRVVQQLQNKSKEDGRDVREIPLPNKTRVAGAQLMFQGLLRNKWAMDVYKNLPGVDDAFTKKYPSHDEWQQLAEYEAVISLIQKCAISIQTDDPATNCWTLLEIYLARREIERMHSSNAAVLSMNSTDYPNNK